MVVVAHVDAVAYNHMNPADDMGFAEDTHIVDYMLKNSQTHMMETLSYLTLLNFYYPSSKNYHKHKLRFNLFIVHLQKPHANTSWPSRLNVQVNNLLYKQNTNTWQLLNVGIFKEDTNNGHNKCLANWMRTKVKKDNEFSNH